jgi:Ribonuclease HepT-like
MNAATAAACLPEDSAGHAREIRDNEPAASDNRKRALKRRVDSVWDHLSGTISEPFEADDGLLLDMLISAREAAEISSGLTFESLERSLLHQNALLHVLQKIGEAATKISEPFNSAAIVPAHSDTYTSRFVTFLAVYIHEFLEEAKMHKPASNVAAPSTSP